MGVGFIQLITAGYEYNIFNKEPQITFFKIYYRRHTNFYINNYEIEGNIVQDNSLLTFKIPKNGDLLSKSYIRVSYDENYVELFKEYTTLYNTLNTNLTDSYDSFSIRVNSFNLDSIEVMKIGKYIFEYNDTTYLTILCTNFKNQQEALEITKSTQNIELETDNKGVFYNINQYYYFYSFKITEEQEKINNNNLVLYLYKQIDFNNLEYIRIDILNYKTSYKIKFEDTESFKYKILFELLVNDLNDVTILSNIKIDKNTLYLSFFYNSTNNLNIKYGDFIKYVFRDIESVSIEFINNKIKSTKVVINNEATTYILKIINNVDTNYTIYYDVFYSKTNTQMVIYSLKNTPYFGNLTVNDFNEGIIYSETQIISISNLYTYKLPINFYIRLLVTLLCVNKPTIQEFLKIVNANQIVFNNLISRYDPIKFNEKILNIIINDNVLILSKSSFRKIIYQNEVKNYYNTDNSILPFSNRKISEYQSIIINIYLYYNILAKFSSRYNQTYDNLEQFLTVLIYLTKINFGQTDFAFLRKSYLQNYLYNNNLFDYIITPDNNILDGSNTSITNLQYKTIENLYYNYLLTLITESINVITKTYLRISKEIYNTDGKYTNLLFNTDLSRSIFPLTSNLFTYSNGLIDNCPPESSFIYKSFSFFNKTLTDFYNTLYSNINKKISQDFNQFKVNFNDKFIPNEQYLIKNTLLNSGLTNIINNYYSTITSDEFKFNNDLIKNFLFTIANTDFISIYEQISAIDLNKIIMANLFIYTDNTIYNGTFSNYTFNKKIYDSVTETCSYEQTTLIKEENYLTFLFNINSPIYRIYFLFTYFGYMSLDPYYKNIIPEDIANLRDLLLKFIIDFIKYFNNINIFQFENLLFPLIDVDLLKNNSISLINNFLCFDEITILENDYFKYLLSINTKGNTENTLLFLYQSFFFNKVQDNFTEKNQDINQIISGYINEYKYNYDDKIIILLLNILDVNKNLFVNYNDVYNLVNNFFNKSDTDYTKFTTSLINIFSKNQSATENYFNYQQLFSNPFYYNCYYTSLSIGTIFDNNNLNNSKTINNTFSLTLNYSTYTKDNNFYNFKSYDIKQFVNYLDNFNITDSLKFIYSLFNQLLPSKDLLAYEYYNQLLDGTQKYVNENFTYLNNYEINDIIFNQCYNIIILYLNKFNTRNNSDINITDSYKYPFTTNFFNKKNFIIVILLYVSFISQCMSLDVNSFINKATQEIQNESFDYYVKSKYSENIYTNCINDLIVIFTNSGIIINLDYSTLLLGKNVLIEQEKLSNNEGIDYLTFMQKIYNNQNQTNTKFNIFYDLENKFSDIQVNINKSGIKNFDLSFYKIYNNNLNNYIFQYNKLLYSLYNGGITNKSIAINNLSETSLQKEYVNILRIIYNNSIFILKNNIYENLYSSYNASFSLSSFSARIINILLDTVKYFYFDDNNNYFKTLFSKKCSVVSSDNSLIDIINNSTNQNSENPSTLNSIDTIVVFISNYYNTTILNSLFYQKELNRIIYMLCTSLVINKSGETNNLTNYFNNNTLYDIVKIYTSSNITSQNNYKNYLANTSLYTDVDIFELFNYENWIENVSLQQNKWINILINKIDLDVISDNSFFYYYNQFKNFSIINYPEIVNFKLTNGLPVIEFFSELINVEELQTFIYDIITTSQDFSPTTIFNSIVNFRFELDISCYLDLNVNNIKKKIIIYLFLNYLVLKFIPKLLIEEYKWDKNIMLEYNLPDRQIDISLNEVLLDVDNIKVINYFISNVYKIDDEPNDNNYELPDNFFKRNEYIFLTQQAKNIINAKNNFIAMIKKYISSYNLVIGDDNIDTDSTINPVKGFTISNAVKRINTVFNNDISTNNFDKYFLTIKLITPMELNIKNIVYDLNNIYDNAIYPYSEFLYNNLNTYRQTDISNINLLLNLVCTSLGFYNITYPELNDDVNLVIGNLRLGSKYVNETLEFIKGLSTNYQISLNMVTSTNILDNNVDSRTEETLSRASNIQYLSTSANKLNDLSIINPSDYDLAINNVNYKKIYLDIYKKYYLYNYNYYNFDKNFKIVYPSIFDYYQKIINYSQSLINMQKYNPSYYKKIFYEIINSYISLEFYSSENNNPISYLNNYNSLISLYKKFNFKFKINKNNVSNVVNLKLQNFFDQQTNFTDYNKMYNYLVSMYYYILLQEPIQANIDSYSYDIINFFNVINTEENFNLLYNKNIVNIFYRLELSIKLIVQIIVSKLQVKINYDEKLLNKIITKITKNSSDVNNLTLFIETYNIKYKSGYPSQDNIYQKMLSIIDYNSFVNILSKSFEELFYYQNFYSIEKNLIMIYEKYWLKSDYYYYEYSNNNYEKRKFVIGYIQFVSVFLEYFNFLENYFNEKFTEENFNILANYIYNLFTIKLPNNKFIQLDYNIIDELIFGFNDTSYSEDYYINSEIFIKKVFNVLKINNWNSIFYDNVNNSQNLNLDTQILFSNYYYAYISNKSINPNYSFEQDDFNYSEFLTNNIRLQILYRLMINIIISSFIAKESYQNIMQSMLTNCNLFVYKGNLIQTIEVSNTMPTFFDYYNQNFIKFNLISNYYKNIQNQTINKITKYKVNFFKEQLNNQDTFMVDIYNKYIKELEAMDENNIGLTIINNTLGGVINNYDGNIDKLVSSSKESSSSVFMINIIKLINSNINLDLEVFKNILGGDSSNLNDIYLTTENIISMFDGKIFKSDNGFVTIFTLIYSQIDKFINSDVVIILFYYTCYLTWISTYGNNYDFKLAIYIYDFANLINTNIIKYLAYETGRKSFSIEEINSVETFFNELNNILFGVYTNLEFTTLCQNFFNKLINQNQIISDKLISQIINFNIETYNGKNYSKELTASEINYFNSKINNNFIQNSKLNQWKFLLGLAVDYNESSIIKLTKSVSEPNTYYNIFVNYVEYIKEINGGFIDTYGIIKNLEYIKLNFDDELIDYLNSQMYKIFFNLNLNLNQFKGVQDMIGININGDNEDYLNYGLSSWILKMGKKNFYIPIHFFFKDNKNAIPLISCMYTDIKLEVLFSSRNIFKNSFVINYLNKFDVKTALNMDYILIEREERKRLSEKTIDNLIETHGNYIQSVNLNEIFFNDQDNILKINFDFEINNIVKELVWELSFFLNGIKISKENYKKFNEESFNIYDFVLNTRFYIDGARRDGIQEIGPKNFNQLTLNINPYRYNTRANNNGIYNVYSFALEPEEFQPTGAINLNLTKIFTIQVTMDKRKLINYFAKTKSLFNLSNVNAQINLTTLQYNFIRYQGGLSGLLFV